jgi:predicted peroxiredoxin
VEKQQKYLFVVQHRDDRYSLMPFSIARTWFDDKGLDIAFYLMYDAVQIVEKDNLEKSPDIQEVIDYLLGKGIPIYTCGFCTRVCANAEKYYPGIQVANRHIYYSLMTERQTVYY